MPGCRCLCLETEGKSWERKLFWVYSALDCIYIYIYVYVANRLHIYIYSQQAVWVGDSSTSFPRLEFHLLTLRTIRLAKSVRLPVLVWPVGGGLLKGQQGCWKSQVTAFKRRVAEMCVMIHLKVTGKKEIWWEKKKSWKLKFLACIASTDIAETPPILNTDRFFLAIFTVYWYFT